MLLRKEYRTSVPVRTYEYGTQRIIKKVTALIFFSERLSYPLTTSVPLRNGNDLFFCPVEK